ncbi:MAG: Nif3-like dinuclear metal center hexameric protein [Oscillospiraceae bacterium]
MLTIRDCYEAIDSFAPFATAEEWDNVGVLVGAPGDTVHRILLALDATAATIAEAKEKRCNLMITHHPVIFRPVSRFSSSDPAYLLAAAKTGLIATHTNLDIAAGGVNETLFHRLGLRPDSMEQSGFVLTGELPVYMTWEGFAGHVKAALNAPGVQLLPGGAKDIRKVALCAGAGGEFIPDAAALGADVFVTGEAKYHELLEAPARGIGVVSAGHFYTENIVLGSLRQMLLERLPGVEILLSDVVSDGTQFV